jgi:hypothetical protein
MTIIQYALNDDHTTVAAKTQQGTFIAFLQLTSVYRILWLRHDSGRLAPAYSIFPA